MNRIRTLLAAALLLVAFTGFGAALHHHDLGEHSTSCAICQASRSVVAGPAALAAPVPVAPQSVPLAPPPEASRRCEVDLAGPSPRGPPLT